MRQRVKVLSRDDLKKDEEEQQMLKDLFDDMHSDRIQYEKRMEESMNFAKSYYSK